MLRRCVHLRSLRREHLQHRAGDVGGIGVRGEENVRRHELFRLRRLPDGRLRAEPSTVLRRHAGDYNAVASLG